MSMNLVTLLYLLASVCFIQALKGLSHPTTSIRGNVFGMSGMAIAVLTTGALIVETAGGSAQGMVYVMAALVLGGAAGTLMAQRVEMTKMPELVAFMHSMIGLAAVFIAVAAMAEPDAFQIVAKGRGTADIPAGNRLELFLGAAIGAITFSGSVIAFGKLSGKYKFRLFQGAPVTFSGQHMLNLVLGLATLALGLVFTFTGSWNAFFAMLALSFVLGVLIIIPIGGADMPGHMNVLLAEAEVPYDQVHEMEDINAEFGQADVAIILGANDVVNPAAHVKGSAIYGMPILEAYKAKTVIVNKRSMAAGYAGLDNELFYMDKTMMVFGDAKKVIEDMGKAIE